MLPDITVAILSQWALYTLLGLSFGLNFRVGGFFDLSVGASFLLAGYFTWFAAQSLPIIAAIPIGILATTLVSIFLGIWFVAPLAARLPPLNLFVITLGVLYLAQAVTGLAFGETAKVLRTGPNPTLQFLGFRISVVQIGLITAAGLVVAILAFMLTRSSWGRLARAVADDRKLADLYALPIQRTLLITYALGGAIAGIAGALFVADQALDPNQAMSALLAAMVASILGGESILGAAVGALALAILETTLGFFMPGYWKSTIVFVVLLAVLIVRRGGVFRFVRRKL